MKNCSKCIFLESKKKQDLYMWYVDKKYFVVIILCLVETLFPKIAQDENN